MQISKRKFGVKFDRNFDVVFDLRWRLVIAKNYLENKLKFVIVQFRIRTYFHSMLFLLTSNFFVILLLFVDLNHKNM